jgi:hypothetical protein
MIKKTQVCADPQDASLSTMSGWRLCSGCGNWHPSREMLDRINQQQTAKLKLRGRGKQK